MHTAVDHVEHRNGQRMHVGPTDGAVEGYAELVGHRLGIGQRHRQHGVGTQPPLVRGPVQIDHGEIDTPLIQGILAPQGAGNLTVHIRHCLQHALAAEPFPPVAQLDRLMPAGRCA